MNEGTRTTLERCRGCGGDTGDNWFDRSICAEPCGRMHTRCRECGFALDECYWEIEIDGEKVERV